MPRKPLSPEERALSAQRRKEYQRRYNAEYRKRPKAIEADKARRATPAAKAKAAARMRHKYATDAEHRARCSATGKAWRTANASRCKKVARAYLEKNRAAVYARMRSWAKKRQAAYKAIVQEYGAQGCARCGFKQALHMHHKDPATKQFAIGNITSSYARCASISPEAFRAELRKCEVLCANCHYLEHRKDEHV